MRRCRDRTAALVSPNPRDATIVLKFGAAWGKIGRLIGATPMKLALDRNAVLLCPAVVVVALTMVSTANAQSPTGSASGGTTRGSAKATKRRIPPPPPLPTRRTKRHAAARRTATSLIPGSNADGRMDMAGQSVSFYPSAKEISGHETHQQSASRGSLRVTPATTTPKARQ